MGIEFLVCMLLATVLTGTRPIADMVQMLRGVEPAHLTKARLRAEREKERDAAALARAEARRVRPGEDKPTFGDVCRVYWGDAMADVIDLHNRRRAAKQERAAAPNPAAVPQGPSLLQQIKELLLQPVGDPKVKPPDDPTTADVEDERPGPVTEYTWNCDRCGTGGPGGFTEDAAAAASQRHIDTVHGGRGAVENRSADYSSIPDHTNGNVNGEPEPAEIAARTSHIAAASADARRDLANQPTLNRPIRPEGDDMAETTSTGGTATGDAHDLESASQQCELVVDDLTAINTAVDVIDEKIGSVGAAVEIIEAFLRSKNADETTVGGMSTARDMLSPDRIKALIDALAAAIQGVRASKEAIDAMNDQATEALQGADGSIVNGR